MIELVLHLQAHSTTNWCGVGTEIPEDIGNDWWVLWKGNCKAGCCMAGMLDTFSSNVTCGNILQCVLCKILDNSCKHTTRKFVSLLNCVSIFSFPFGYFYLPCLSFPPSSFNSFIFSLFPLPSQGESVWISRRWTDWGDDGQWCEGNGRTAQAESVLGKRQHLGVLL